MVHRSIGVSKTGIPKVILGMVKLQATFVPSSAFLDTHLSHSPISGGVVASLQPCFCSKLEPSQLTPKIRLVSYDGGIAMLMAGPLCGAAIRTWNGWRAQDGAGCFGQSEPLGYTSIWSYILYYIILYCIILYCIVLYCIIIYTSVSIHIPSQKVTKITNHPYLQVTNPIPSYFAHRNRFPWMGKKSSSWAQPTRFLKDGNIDSQKWAEICCAWISPWVFTFIIGI